MESIDLKRRRLAALLAAGAAGAAIPLRAAFAANAKAGGQKRVVVLTSYTEEFTSRFVKGFEAAHPGSRVEIAWRQSADALAYLRRGGTAEVDVIWTPAPRNFATLKEAGKLAKLTFIDHAALPGKVGGEAISDPDGFYAAFELAGYGIAYNPEAVRQLGLPAPRDWRDLADPGYRGKVELPIPGRVGFAPVAIESVLQGYGWTEGWATLAGIAANTEFGRGDRTSEADAVLMGNKAARLTIDFFTAPSRRNANPAKGELAFVYPPKTAFNPSHVAITAQAPHPDMARAFVEFVLSKPAQEMLLGDDVRRLPVRRDIYAEHPELSARPFDSGTLAYDDVTRRARQGLVATLFDVTLVQPHAELVALWEALARAEKKGVSANTREARALLSATPVDEAAQRDDKLRALFAFAELAPGKPEPKPGEERLAVEKRWKADVAARIAKARQLLA
ncbi:MAG: ABC transporter substrate-binding protein [Azoarcus sp.]|jgi:ABC-type Fe3+ transport system substrate-binding protein|nr:ABC transporter substrate-binding protein [Azoarcus sp.]